MALPPAPGSVLPRCGPPAPPGFFVPSAAAASVSRGGESEPAAAAITVPPRAAVFRRGPAAVGSTALAVGLRATRPLRPGDPVFEEDLLFVGDTTPHAVASGGVSSGSSGGGNGVLLPAFPTGRTAAAQEVAKGAAALWRVLAAQQLKDRAPTRGAEAAAGGAAPPMALSNAFLDAGDAFGGSAIGGGSPSDASAAAAGEYAELVEASARAYTVAVAQCMAIADEPRAAPWARLHGLTLRDVCPERAAAERNVRAAVMLHQLTCRVLQGKQKSDAATAPVAVSATPEDIATVHALASEHALRTHELYPGGPAAFGGLTSCAVAVPFAVAANCKVEVVPSTVTAENTLRVRVVACSSEGGDDAVNGGVAIREGEELRLLRAPLLTGADAEAARAASSSSRAGAPATSAKSHRLGETESEAARRKMLDFLGNARQDPQALQRLMALKQQQEQRDGNAL